MCFRYVNMFRKDGDHDRYKECTYVLLEGSITQADGAQSSRVPVPLSDDPYVAIRQAQLVDTKSEPKEAPSEAE
ncbi:hypothetical protein Tco_0123192 [Tanacetum coccineum]